MKWPANQWSLDLETLSTRPNAVILSVGLAQFDANTNQITRKHEFVLNSLVQRDELGRDVSEATVAWWKEQSAEAQRVLSLSADTDDDLDATMREIAETVAGTGTGGDAIVWGNGSDFDCVLLRSLYDDCGIKAPWSFRSSRDMRTLVALEPMITMRIPNSRRKMIPPVAVREGTHHNALDDAAHQARIIMRLMRMMTI